MWWSYGKWFYIYINDKANDFHIHININDKAMVSKFCIYFNDKAMLSLFRIMWYRIVYQ